MTEEKWRYERAGKFTASEIYKLLVSPRSKSETISETSLTYIKQKAVECLVPIDKLPQLRSAAILWGSEHEAEANEAYTNSVMLEEDNQVIAYGKENPVFFPLLGHEHFAGGSPDAIHAGKVIEYKCPYDSLTHLENLLMTADEFKTKRKEYYAQIQFNMMCTGLDKARFVSYDPRFSDPSKRLAIIDIDYDTAFCEAILEKLSVAEDKLTNILSNF